MPSWMVSPSWMRDATLSAMRRVTSSGSSCGAWEISASEWMKYVTFSMGTRMVPSVRGILSLTSKMTVSHRSSISSSICWLMDMHTQPYSSIGVTAAKNTFGLRQFWMTLDTACRWFGTNEMRPELWCLRSGGP